MPKLRLRKPVDGRQSEIDVRQLPMEFLDEVPCGVVDEALLALVFAKAEGDPGKWVSFARSLWPMKYGSFEVQV